MKISSFLLSIALLASSAQAYQPAAASSSSSSSRRELLTKAAFGAAAVAFMPTKPVQAMDACPPKSSNCIRTTWTPPAGTKKADVVKTVKEVLNAYPQEGQEKVDMGGWTIVEDDLAGSGTARVEYKSGIGNFAKFFNAGKPFIDDLKLEIADSGAVEVRSSSRIGESDLDVNRKRLVYLGKALTAKGWTIPEPKY